MIKKLYSVMIHLNVSSINKLYIIYNEISLKNNVDTIPEDMNIRKKNEKYKEIISDFLIGNLIITDLNWDISCCVKTRFYLLQLVKICTKLKINIF